MLVTLCHTLFPNYLKSHSIDLTNNSKIINLIITQFTVQIITKNAYTGSTPGTCLLINGVYLLTAYLLLMFQYFQLIQFICKAWRH